MPTPGELKTVQARILEYAEALGWTILSREKAEQRRGLDSEVPPADRPRGRSLFFDELLDAKVREFNPRYAEAEGPVLGQFCHLHTDIYGNRGKFFDHGEKRERDHFQDLFRTLLHELMTAKTRVHNAAIEV